MSKSDENSQKLNRKKIPAMNSNSQEMHGYALGFLIPKKLDEFGILSDALSSHQPTRYMCAKRTKIF